jgi:hypothetical protein
LNGEFIFTINGSGIYTTEETPVVVRSSGGGGGSSSHKTYYTCTEWSSWSKCSDGEQSRVCVEKTVTSSETNFQSSETQSCISGETDEEENNAELEENENQETESQTSSGPGITGAVINAVVSPYGIGAIVFIGLVSAAAGMILFRRRELLKQYRVKDFSKRFIKDRKISDY